MSQSKEKFICPKCKKKILSDFNTSEGVVVDFCEECSGIWFDKNELASYIELSMDIPEITTMKKAGRKTGLLCPKCSGFLEELPFSSKTSILVERCEKCGGIFFDAGELKEAESAAARLEKTEDRLEFVVKRFTDEGYRPL